VLKFCYGKFIINTYNLGKAGDFLPSRVGQLLLEGSYCLYVRYDINGIAISNLLTPDPTQPPKKRKHEEVEGDVRAERSDELKKSSILLYINLTLPL
jgi:hypothetical protein